MDAKPTRPKPIRWKSSRPAKPKTTARPRPEESSQVDYFPPKRGNSRRSAPVRQVEADLCQITADEVNAFLRSLPPRQKEKSDE